MYGTRCPARSRVLATGIPLGKTVEVGSARIHRYRDHFQVTDLTNAGKRGLWDDLGVRYDFH